MPRSIRRTYITHHWDRRLVALDTRHGHTGEPTMRYGVAEVNDAVKQVPRVHAAASLDDLWPVNCARRESGVRFCHE